jgi:hypothetical protein
LRRRNSWSIDPMIYASNAVQSVRLPTPAVYSGISGFAPSGNSTAKAAKI